MRPILLFLALIALGCGSSTTGPAEKGPAKPPSPGPELPITKESRKTEKPKTEHDDTGWKSYAPKEAAFEVKFPRDPVVKPAVQKGQFHVVGIPRKNREELGYTCQWKIREQPYIDRTAEAFYLKGNQLGALTASKGKLIKEEEIALDGFQGREFVIEFPDTSYFRSRVYVAGKRIIGVQLSGKDEQAISSPDALKFLDSVKISEAPKP